MEEKEGILSQEAAAKELLKLVAEKVKGEQKEDLVVADRGFSIKVQVGRLEKKEGVVILQAVFVIWHDDFDEPITEPIDTQGADEKEAMEIATNMFMGGVWHSIAQSFDGTNAVEASTDYFGQHYEYDMYCKSVVRVGVVEKDAAMLVRFIKDEIPKYLGSKKYYWLRIQLSKYQDQKVISVRMNGAECLDLHKYFEEYLDKEMDGSKGYVMEEQYAFFVRYGDDTCPFDRDQVFSAATETVKMMEDIMTREDYKNMSDKLETLVNGNSALASEIRLFIPEILAKLTLGFREGDSLFLVSEKNGQLESKEFKKTQLRSYYYIQQAMMLYLSTKPDQEKLGKIVCNSAAFAELKKAMAAYKEQGRELKPVDLYVKGTSYRITTEDYMIW